MSGRVTRKRARLEAEEEAAEDENVASEEQDLEGFTQDEEFWFEDGTVALTARDVAFKVFKSPLAEHSPVFKDMFTLPQPTNASGDDKLPIIALSDSPEDLRHVLGVLMPGKTLRVYGVQTLSFDTISAWIRLGHKYQIDHLVDQSVEYLRKLYPDDWNVYCKIPTSMAFKPIHAIGVVNLARLTGADSILPLALMKCCDLGPAIAEGFEREDGTEEYLSLADLGLCFKLKETLIEARVQIVHRILVYPDNDHDSCHQDIEVFLQALCKGTVRGLCTPRPLATWTTLMKTQLPNICDTCHKVVLDKASAERRALFERLPSVLGITVKDWGKHTKTKST